ncbi:Thymidine phosphorylase OS=Rhodanobacter lindaniclasticus OX=75310 GN=B1991_11550 PE=4 SV=1 [Rhodanobacter lindaniclasticus]
MPFGSWFEFVDPASGQIARRKLAWYSPMSGRCLLVSRRGQRGEEMTMAQLAHEVARGRACEVPAQPESLLDRAWRGLTGSLRQAAAGGRGGKPAESRQP